MDILNVFLSYHKFRGRESPQENIEISGRAVLKRMAAKTRITGNLAESFAVTFAGSFAGNFAGTFAGPFAETFAGAFPTGPRYGKWRGGKTCFLRRGRKSCIIGKENRNGGNAMTLGQRLRAYREKEGLTQEQLRKTTYDPYCQE